jgi:hypothetical protein
MNRLVLVLALLAAALTVSALAAPGGKADGYVDSYAIGLWATCPETPGNNAQSANNDVQWVEATISDENPEVFSFEQEIVRPNLVAYVP